LGVENRESCAPDLVNVEVPFSMKNAKRILIDFKTSIDMYITTFKMVYIEVYCFNSYLSIRNSL